MNYYSVFTFIALLLVEPIQAFTAPSNFKSLQRRTNLNAAEEDSNAFVDDLKTKYRIYQESNASGASFKQTIANVIAGEYNKAEVKAEVEESINSAPCGE